MKIFSDFLPDFLKISWPLANPSLFDTLRVEIYQKSIQNISVCC